MPIVPPLQSRLNSFGWIAMKFATGINCTLKMDPRGFGDPLTFCRTLPWGSHLWS